LIRSRDAFRAKNIPRLPSEAVFNERAWTVFLGAFALWPETAGEVKGYQPRQSGSPDHREHLGPRTSACLRRLKTRPGNGQRMAIKGFAALPRSFAEHKTLALEALIASVYARGD